MKVIHSFRFPLNLRTINKFIKFNIMESDNNKDKILNEEKEKFSVTVENVSGRIDYDKLISKFGTEKITPNLLEKFEFL